MVNDAAATDPACQAAMTGYLEELKREAKRRQAIRDAAAADQQAWFAKWEAMRPKGTYGTWNISDRD